MTFDAEYTAWLESLEEEQLIEEQESYALGKEPTQCQACGAWLRSKDLYSDGVCEDCYEEE